ncbi:hypothetical protein [Ferrimonas balearica]|uniref:hypothetical protein n=1 Tax=Ferrimonas balearica TaxID=44012 RepID=UPI001C9954EA|nr:hypothetical protein [Ferrimonas balearica]MBY5994176.1 hypothetical protein [Ferrimonas balearica]
MTLFLILILSYLDVTLVAGLIRLRFALRHFDRFEWRYGEHVRVSAWELLLWPLLLTGGGLRALVRLRRYPSGQARVERQWAQLKDTAPPGSSLDVVFGGNRYRVDTQSLLAQLEQASGRCRPEGIHWLRRYRADWSTPFPTPSVLADTLHRPLWRLMEQEQVTVHCRRCGKPYEGHDVRRHPQAALDDHPHYRCPQGHRLLSDPDQPGDRYEVFWRLPAEINRFAE